MTTYIIYHQVKPGVDCPDGIAAAWVASRAYPDAEVIGAVYQEPPAIQPEPGDQIILVDFSYPTRVITDWRERCVTVTIIDHHKTALQDIEALPLSALIKPHFDMNECGATLAWKTLFPDEPMPALLPASLLMALTP